MEAERECSDVPQPRSFSFDTPQGTAILLPALARANLKTHGIGAVRKRFSKTRGSAYLSNGCVHCDALQGAFFVPKVVQYEVAALTVDCMMGSELFTPKVLDSPYRWAFDESFEGLPRNYRPAIVAAASLPHTDVSKQEKIASPAGRIRIGTVFCQRANGILAKHWPVAAGPRFVHWRSNLAVWNSGACR